MDKPLLYSAYQQCEISVFKVLTATHKPMHTIVKLFSLLVHILFKKLFVATELPQIVF